MSSCRFHLLGPELTLLQDTEPAAISSQLTTHLLPALQLHLLPKSALDVHLLILESDSIPNVLSAGLTVASAAIADAGIPMNALGVGVTVCKTEKEMLVDPDEDEGNGEGTLGIGLMPAVGKISGLWLDGEMEVEDAILVRRPSLEGQTLSL